jgi:metalloendopeptidase OMA1, mitochondrial
MNKKRVCRYLTIATGLSLFIMACVNNKEAGRRAFIIVPDSQMNSMGMKSYREILKTEKILKNTRLNKIVSRIGSRIAKASGAKFKWEFNVIKNDKMVNAFCLPGGKVAVYTGIIKVAKNEAGLAAIMGHEVAHATLKHGSERVSQAMAAQLGLSLATLSFENTAHRDLIVAALGIGTKFGILMPFSRKHETEADVVGLRYMAKAGYAPSEAVFLWQRMAALGGKMPEIISTHPAPLKRSELLRSKLPSVMKIYNKSSKQPSREI